MKTCRTCKFEGHTEHTSEKGYASGPGCRRHAPGSGYWTFPPVNPDQDWCGDYEEKGETEAPPSHSSPSVET